MKIKQSREKERRHKNCDKERTYGRRYERYETRSAKYEKNDRYYEEQSCRKTKKKQYLS